MRRKFIMRNSVSQNSPRRAILRIFFPLLGIITILSLSFILNSNIWTIKNLKINIENNLCVTQEEIKSKLDILGKNLIFLNTEIVRKKILGNFICVKDAKISRVFPDAVFMEIQNREPAAILLISHEQEASVSAENIATPSAKDLSSFSDYFVVDKEGVVFSKEASSASLPKIYFYSEDISIGKTLEKGLVTNTLKVLERLNIFGVYVQEAIISFNKFLIIKTVPTIIFRLDESLNEQLASLQLILEKAKIDSSPIEFIDLRFNKPVIRLAPKKNKS